MTRYLLDLLNRTWHARHAEPETQDDPRLWQAPEKEKEAKE